MYAVMSSKKQHRHGPRSRGCLWCFLPSDRSEASRRNQLSSVNMKDMSHDETAKFRVS
jgi:hypothetical protein